MRLSIASISLVSLLFAGGCDIYFGGGGGGDDDCDFGGSDGSGGSDAFDPAPGVDEYLRNPDTGQCEYFGGGGGGGWECDDPCAPCPDRDEPGAPAPLPSWGSCESFCDGLDEASCYETAGCRAAFVEDTYYGCWAVDQSGPVSGGGCDEFDSYECSRHDDCVAVHEPGLCGTGAPADEAEPPPCPDIGWFSECRAEETGCYGDADCPDDAHCNAAEVCLPPPGCEDPSGDPDSDPGLGKCDAVCYGMCVPDVPIDPGSCTGDIFCDAEPPGCPPDSVPGRRDGCWTGFCIPVEACDDPPPPPPLCPDIGEEAACIDAGCSPLYVGEDCTCDADGCTCTWKFIECT